MEQTNKPQRVALPGPRSVPLRDAASAAPAGRAEASGEMRLLDYWFFLKPWWLKILVASAVALLLTLVVDAFVRTHWYRAQAIIRPASQEGPTSPLATMMSTSPLAGGLSALMGATGLSGQTPSDAAEHMAILSSYDFATALVVRHNLGPVLDRKSLVDWLLTPLSWLIERVERYFPGEGTPDPRWRWYKKTTDRFDSDYDDQQGNLTLGFSDPDPRVAKRVLGYYIDALREKLRNRTIREASAAAQSFEEELGRTADPLIQTQIAILIAQQIQQEKIAQVQANFAFTVTEPPYAGDHLDRPNFLLDGALAVVVTPLLMVLWLIFYYRLYLPARELDRQAQLEAQGVAASGDGIDAAVGDSKDIRASGP